MDGWYGDVSRRYTRRGFFYFFVPAFLLRETEGFEAGKVYACCSMKFRTDRDGTEGFQ